MGAAADASTPILRETHMKSRQANNRQSRSVDFSSANLHSGPKESLLPEREADGYDVEMAAARSDNDARVVAGEYMNDLNFEDYIGETGMESSKQN